MGQSWGTADLSGIAAGILQAQQQRDDALEHQLPEGAAEPHPEPAPAPPHQRPEKPHGRGADRLPGLRGRARSGQTEQAAFPTVIRGPGGRGVLRRGRDGPERGWGGAGARPGGRGLRRPAAAGGAAPAGRSGAARAPAAAAGASPARPAPRPRASRRPRPAHPAARAAACSRAAPAGAATRGRPLAAPPGPPPPALSLTFPRSSARWLRPSRPSQRTVGSGSPCQARSRSRMTSSRRSLAVGRLCSS